ncbi:hypothetical protein KKC94_00925 [Patescibacteria group bacterium]|nr:hypothetical protein [Patescibacteria group bacterium]
MKNKKLLILLALVVVAGVVGAVALSGGTTSLQGNLQNVADSGSGAVPDAATGTIVSDQLTHLQIWDYNNERLATQVTQSTQGVKLIRLTFKSDVDLKVDQVPYTINLYRDGVKTSLPLRDYVSSFRLTDAISGEQIGSTYYPYPGSIIDKISFTNDFFLYANQNRRLILEADIVQGAFKTGHTTEIEAVYDRSLAPWNVFGDGNHYIGFVNNSSTLSGPKVLITQ